MTYLLIVTLCMMTDSGLECSKFSKTVEDVQACATEVVEFQKSLDTHMDKKSNVKIMAYECTSKDR
jgi:hypothetical protein